MSSKPSSALRAQEWLKEALRKAQENNFKESVSKAKAARDAAVHNVPVMKMEPDEFQDGHAWLANECRRDPVNVDDDIASHGWTNWEVKKEPLAKFANLSTRCSTKVIDLDTPSPAKRPRIATSLPSLPSMPSRPVMNPGNAELGFLDDEESDDVPIEKVFEDFMDATDGFPQVGEAPGDE